MKENELKRYVLLNNNVIYDMKNDYDVKKYNMVKNASALHYQFKTTSDNILDLAEPCTLWDLDGDLYEHTLGDFVVLDKVFSDSSMNGKNITAIYKRQPNGDYKRYEVER